jgi:hypothetical protein
MCGGLLVYFIRQSVFSLSTGSSGKRRVRMLFAGLALINLGFQTLTPELHSPKERKIHMGKLSLYFQNRSDKILDDPKFQEALKYYSAADALEPGTISAVSENIVMLIEDLLSGRRDNGDILGEIKEEIDQIIYLLREVADMLKHTVPVSAQAYVFINETLKPRLEEITQASYSWESNLKSDSPAIQAGTINTIMQQYIALQAGTIAAFDSSYAFYDSIALSFLLLALLNNMLRQGPVYINNAAPRFVSYFNRAVNVAFSDSLAKKLVDLVADCDKIRSGFPSRQISWGDGRCMEIEGNVKDGFTYRQWRADRTQPLRYEEDMQVFRNIRFSPANTDEWINSYENAHERFTDNLKKIEMLKAAVAGCTAYVKTIQKHIIDRQ